MNVTSATPMKRTNIHGIRHELASLWASTEITENAVIRARTHNLIVYAADDVSAKETTRRVIEKTVERPGRVIVIDVDPDKSDALDAWVTIFCKKVNRQLICGEMITLTVSPARAEEVHSTILSLLASDLPVFLMWMGLPDPQDHLFSHLAPSVDRILVDSDSFANHARGLRSLAALQETFRVGDLAWAKLSPWRQLLAQCWDVHELRNSLQFINKLDIEHAAANNPNTAGRALLLLGWLSQRLGWSVSSSRREKPSRYHVDWQSESVVGTSTVSENPAVSAAAAEISHVIITASGRQSEVSLHLELSQDSRQVETRIGDGHRISMKSSCVFRSPSDSRALAEEIDYGYDPSYADALRAAAGMLELSDSHSRTGSHGRHR